MSTSSDSSGSDVKPMNDSPPVNSLSGGRPLTENSFRTSSVPPDPGAGDALDTLFSGLDLSAEIAPNTPIPPSTPQLTSNPGNPLLAHLSKLVPLDTELKSTEAFLRSDFQKKEPSVTHGSCVITSYTENHARRAEGDFGASITFINRPPPTDGKGNFTRSVEVSGHFVNNMWFEGYGLFYPAKLPVFHLGHEPHVVLEYHEPVYSEQLVEYRTAVNKRIFLPAGFRQGEHDGMFFLRGVKGFDAMILLYSTDFSPLRDPQRYPRLSAPLSEPKLLEYSERRVATGEKLELTFYFIRPEFRGRGKKLDELLDDLDRPGRIETSFRIMSDKEYVRECIKLTVNSLPTPEGRKILQARFDKAVPDWSLVSDERIAKLLPLFEAAPLPGVIRRYAPVTDLVLEPVTEDKTLHHQGRSVLLQTQVSTESVDLGPSERLFLDGQSPNLGLGLEMISPLVHAGIVNLHLQSGKIAEMVTTARSITSSKLTPQRGRNRQGRYWRERIKLSDFLYTSIFFIPDPGATEGVKGIVRCINNHVLAETIVGRINPVGIGVVRYRSRKIWDYEESWGDYLDSHSFRPPDEKSNNDGVISPMIAPIEPSSAGPDCLLPEGVVEALAQARVRFNIYEHLQFDARLEITITSGGTVFTDYVQDGFCLKPSDSEDPRVLFVLWNSSNRKRPPESAPTKAPLPLTSSQLDDTMANAQAQPGWSQTKSASAQRPVSVQNQRQVFQMMSQGKLYNAYIEAGKPVLLDEVPILASSSHSSSSAVSLSTVSGKRIAGGGSSQEKKPVQASGREKEVVGWEDFTSHAPPIWQTLTKNISREDVLYYYSRVLDHAFNGTCGKTVKRMKEKYFAAIPEPTTPPAEFSFYRPPDGSGGNIPHPLGKVNTGSNYQ